VSWRDRAISVDTAPASAGGWRSRAVPVQTDEPKTVEGFVKNAAADLGRLATAPAMIFKKAAYDIPRDFIKTNVELSRGTPISETTMGQNALSFRDSAPAMAKEIVRPVTDFKNYSYENPVSQAVNLIPALGATAGIAKRATPMIARTAETASADLARRSLGFTKRFLNTEGKAANAAEASKIAMDEGIITPGATPEQMLDRVNALSERAGQEIGSILKTENRGAKRSLSSKTPPQAREAFLFDQKKAVSELDKLRPRSNAGKVLRGGDYDAQNAAIDDAIETIQAHGDRPLPWDEANKLKGNLRANWDTTKSKPVNEVKKSIYGVFRDNIDKQLESAMVAGGRDVKNFLQAKRVYKAAEDMKAALQNRLSSETGNNLLSLTDLIAGGVGAGVGDLTGGVGTILAKKALQRYGVTAGASATRKIGILLREAPAVFGEYAATLRKALSRGQKTFDSTANRLMENKDFKSIVDNIDDGSPSAPPDLEAPQPYVQAPDVTPKPPAFSLPSKAVEQSAPVQKMSLQEFGDFFQQQEGVPPKEAARWMANYKRDPSLAAKMIGDYAKKTIKNRDEARRWSVGVRQSIKFNAERVKVGGLSRKQAKAFGGE